MDTYTKAVLTAIGVVLVIIAARPLWPGNVVAGDLSQAIEKACQGLSKADCDKIGQKMFEGTTIRVPRAWGRFTTVVFSGVGGVPYWHFVFEAPDGSIRMQQARPKDSIVRD